MKTKPKPRSLPKRGHGGRPAWEPGTQREHLTVTVAPTTLRLLRGMVEAKRVPSTGRAVDELAEVSADLVGAIRATLSDKVPQDVAGLAMLNAVARAQGRPQLATMQEAMPAFMVANPE